MFTSCYFFHKVGLSVVWLMLRFPMKIIFRIDTVLLWLLWAWRKGAILLIDFEYVIFQRLVRSDGQEQKTQGETDRGPMAVTTSAGPASVTSPLSLSSPTLTITTASCPHRHTPGWGISPLSFTIIFVISKTSNYYCVFLEISSLEA